MAHNSRLGFRPSPAALKAAAREAAKAARAAKPAEVIAADLRLCGLAAIQARFTRQPGSIQRLFFDRATAPSVGAICQELARARKVYRQVEPAELEKISGSVHHGGIVAFVTPPVLRSPSPADLSQWSKRAESMLLLDRIGNAHNLGAIARTAAFFGVTRIVIPDHPGAAKPGDAAYRVAEGGLEHVEVWQVKSLAAFARAAAGAGFEVVGAATRGGGLEAPPRKAGQPVALVLGNEEEGFAPDVEAACTRLVTIPGSGNVESLNVSVAAAVLMWECLARQGLARR